MDRIRQYAFPARHCRASQIRIRITSGCGRVRADIWQPRLHSAVAIGALLYVNRNEPTISTTIGEQRMLTLADGSRIFLNTQTRLFVTEEPARRQVRLDSGEALFDVTKDPSRPFVPAIRRALRWRLARRITSA